jgi:hypothetical protein
LGALWPAAIEVVGVAVGTVVGGGKVAGAPPRPRVAGGVGGGGLLGRGGGGRRVAAGGGGRREEDGGGRVEQHGTKEDEANGLRGSPGRTLERPI